MDYIIVITIAHRLVTLIIVLLSINRSKAWSKMTTSLKIAITIAFLMAISNNRITQTTSNLNRASPKLISSNKIWFSSLRITSCSKSYCKMPRNSNNWNNKITKLTITLIIIIFRIITISCYKMHYWIFRMDQTIALNKTSKWCNTCSN